MPKWSLWHSRSNRKSISPSKHIIAIWARLCATPGSALRQALRYARLCATPGSALRQALRYARMRLTIIYIIISLCLVLAEECTHHFVEAGNRTLILPAHSVLEILCPHQGSSVIWQAPHAIQQTIAWKPQGLLLITQCLSCVHTWIYCSSGQNITVYVSTL